MRILVVSDVHGRESLLWEAIEQQPTARTVLFLGDGLRDLNVISDDVTVRSVRGNCDFIGADIPETRLEVFGSYRIFMTHGHRYGVKFSEEAVIQAAVAADADVLIYGHVHLPINRYLPAGERVGETVLKKPLIVFCPGSLGEPRGGKPCFGTLTIRDNGILAAHGEL